MAQGWRAERLTPAELASLRTFVDDPDSLRLVDEVLGRRMLVDEEIEALEAPLLDVIMGGEETLSPRWEEADHLVGRVMSQSEGFWTDGPWLASGPGDEFFPDLPVEVGYDEGQRQTIHAVRAALARTRSPYVQPEGTSGELDDLGVVRLELRHPAGHRITVAHGDAPVLGWPGGAARERGWSPRLDRLLAALLGGPVRLTIHARAGRPHRTETLTPDGDRFTRWRLPYPGGPATVTRRTLSFARAGRCSRTASFPGVPERATWFRPAGLPGVEALHASFERHRYRPHSHPTWTVALMERGAASFTVDARHERADHGECFVLEPEAVHTGIPAVREGWAYKVLYLDPEVLSAWEERDGPAPRAARWVVFRDARLTAALLAAHGALAGGAAGLERDVPVLAAVDALRPHLRDAAPTARGGAEHPAVRRAEAHLRERWDRTVPLAELAVVARLSPSELVRRFRRHTGLPPHAYQVGLRVARARALLERGTAPAAVAAACGFYDQAHLTRTFRRTVGVTPARYARAAGSARTS